MKKSFDLKVVCCVIAMTMAPGPCAAFDTIASDFAFSNLQRKLLDQRLEQAARDPGLLDQIAQAAARMALQNGIDLAALQVTPRGFELR
ncbi:MAG: hypothetical protein AAGM21_10235 [Pseudomonadota bacterium]